MQDFVGFANDDRSGPSEPDVVLVFTSGSAEDFVSTPFERCLAEATEPLVVDHKAKQILTGCFAGSRGELNLLTSFTDLNRYDP